MLSQGWSGQDISHGSNNALKTQNRANDIASRANTSPKQIAKQKKRINDAEEQIKAAKKTKKNNNVANDTAKIASGAVAESTGNKVQDLANE